MRRVAITFDMKYDFEWVYNSLENFVDRNFHAFLSFSCTSDAPKAVCTCLYFTIIHSFFMYKNAVLVFGDMTNVTSYRRADS